MAKFDVRFYSGYKGKRADGVYSATSIVTLASRFFGKKYQINYLRSDDAQIILNGVMKCRITAYHSSEEVAGGTKYMQGWKKVKRMNKVPFVKP